MINGKSARDYIMQLVEAVLNSVDDANPDAGYYDYFDALHEQTNPRYA
jgi:hypothetical protein